MLEPSSGAGVAALQTIAGFFLSLRERIEVRANLPGEANSDRLKDIAESRHHDAVESRFRGHAIGLVSFSAK
jgi:hypothetical protein